MTNVLPLLKRKKAAATCTLSLTSVSVHRSAVPFPSSLSHLPDIPTLASTSSNSSAPQPVPRPRQRTHASLLRRKRCALGVEPEKPASSSSSPAHPRKRARKSSLSPPAFYPSPKSMRTLPTRKNSLAAALGFSSSPFTGDLMFLCNVYRSIAWARLHREFTRAEKSLSSMMDVDMDTGNDTLSDMDKQESVFMERLRSYLNFHEINPRWLDVTSHLPSSSLSPDSTSWVDNMDVDGSQESSSPLTHSASPSLPTLLRLPINPQPQIIASLLFRHRHRVKLSSGTAKSRLLAQIAHAEPGRSRRTPRSPLASISAS